MPPFSICIRIFTNWTITSNVYSEVNSYINVFDSRCQTSVDGCCIKNEKADLPGVTVQQLPTLHSNLCNLEPLTIRSPTH